MPNVDISDQDSYSVHLRSSDRSGASVDQILDFVVNHAPTDILASQLELLENLQVGEVVLSLATLDSDPEDQFVYSFAPGLGARDNDMFTLEGSDLLTRVPADFEEDEILQIRVRATDQNGLSVVRRFELSVQDVAEAPIVINDPPYLISPSGAVIPRSSNAGDLVAWLHVLDPDQDDSVSIELVKGVGDSDNNLFTISGTKLLLSAPVDSLDRSSLSIRLRATDSYGATFEQNLTFQLPTTILASSEQFSEALPIGASVAELSISGGESLSDIIFDISSSSSSSFAVDGNRLILLESLDFETQQIHRVKLTAEDSSGFVVEREFEFSVSDSNDPPSSILVSTSDIPQDALADQLVASLTAFDQDTNDSLSFSLLSVTAGGEPVDGVFTLVEDRLFLDTDARTLIDSSYNLSLEAIDSSGASFVQDISLSVVPTVSLSSTQISEGLYPLSSIATLSTTNDVAGDVSYSLVSGDGSNDNQLFLVSDDQLLINFYSDHEQRTDYSVRLQSLDSSGTKLERSFDLFVPDINEAPFDLSISVDTIDENVPAKASVAVIDAQDPDFSDSLSFSLISGEGDDDNHLFNVSGDQLLVKQSPDFESQSSFNIRLRAADRRLSSVEKSFEISVVDLNDAPHTITSSTQFLSSTAESRSTVAEFSTLDDDLRDFHRYSLPDGVLDNDSFFLLGNKLKLQPSVDLAEQSSYTVSVISSDFDGASVQQDIEFALNHPPESISMSASAFKENLPAGTPILTFSTSDPDVDDLFTYTLDDGFGAQDNDLFAISGDSLISSAPIDFETDSSLNLRIRSTDQYGHSIVERFELGVTDIDEPPSVPVLTTSSVDENVPPGSVVGTIRSSDPENLAGVSLEILMPRLAVADADADNVVDASLFSLSGDQLLLDISPDFEAQSSYSFVVRATDASGLISEGEIVVHINDLLEPITSLQSIVLPDSLDTLYLTGEDPVNGFGNAADNRLIGTSSDNVLAGRGGSDVLTGLPGVDTFLYERYTDSRLSAYDVITDFDMSVDRIDAPYPVSSDQIFVTGIAPGLDSDSLREHLDSARFPSGSAAFFTVIDGYVGMRTLLALNNSVPGFSSDTDAIIDVTGYVGELSDLLVI